MKKLTRVVLVLLAAVLLMAPLTGCGASDGKTHLTFQIWDVNQRKEMQAMCDAYTAQHPDVEIEVQVTSWGEYWTKLEAAAESNTMPDIFWMHTNQLLYYADFGILADVTDLYDDIDPNYYENHFTEISRNNASGSDGRLYGVPKDKDNGNMLSQIEKPPVNICAVFYRQLQTLETQRQIQGSPKPGPLKGRVIPFERVR